MWTMVPQTAQIPVNVRHKKVRTIRVTKNELIVCFLYFRLNRQYFKVIKWEFQFIRRLLDSWCFVFLSDYFMMGITWYEMTHT